jgi:hypothetical protein
MGLPETREYQRVAVEDVKDVQLPSGLSDINEWLSGGYRYDSRYSGQRSDRRFIIFSGKDSHGTARKIGMQVLQNEQPYPTKCVYTLNVIASPEGKLDKFSHFEPAVGDAIDPRVVKRNAIQKLWRQICEKYFE